MTEQIKKYTTATIDNAQTKDLGHGVVEVIVSTESIDRHGETVSIKGLDTKNYNGSVFLNHDYNQLPIGKSIALRKSVVDGKPALISRTQFAVNEYPIANTVYKLVSGGYMPDVSIGFIPKEWDEGSQTWTKSSMIEYSHVGIGANIDAKVMGKALNAVGVTEKQLQEQMDNFAKSIGQIKEEQKIELTKSIENVHNQDNTEIVELVKSVKALTLALGSYILPTTNAKSEQQTQIQHKHKIVVLGDKKQLAKAKQTAHLIDKTAELLIAELKNQLKN